MSINWSILGRSFAFSNFIVEPKNKLEQTKSSRNFQNIETLKYTLE